MRTLIVDYNNWNRYAGNTFIIKDQDGTEVYSGTVDISGCDAGIEIEVEDDTIFIEWFIDDVKLMSSSIITHGLTEEQSEQLETILDKVSGGSGQFRVVIKTDIPGAIVRVRDTGSNVSWTLVADSSGDADFGLFNSTWNYVINAFGYIGATGTIIADADKDVTVNLSPFNDLDPPDDPMLTNVVLDLKDFGEPLQNVRVTIRVVKSKSTVLVNGVYDITHLHKDTDENGRVVFEVYPSSLLPRENGKLLKYVVECPKIDFFKSFIVPDEGINLKDV